MTTRKRGVLGVGAAGTPAAPLAASTPPASSVLSTPTLVAHAVVSAEAVAEELAIEDLRNVFMKQKKSVYKRESILRAPDAFLLTSVRLFEATATSDPNSVPPPFDPPKGDADLNVTLLEHRTKKMAANNYDPEAARWLAERIAVAQGATPEQLERAQLPDVIETNVARVSVSKKLALGVWEHDVAQLKGVKLHVRAPDRLDPAYASLAGLDAELVVDEKTGKRMAVKTPEVARRKPRSTANASRLLPMTPARTLFLADERIPREGGHPSVMRGDGFLPVGGECVVGVRRDFAALEARASNYMTAARMSIAETVELAVATYVPGTSPMQHLKNVGIFDLLSQHGRSHLMGLASTEAGAHDAARRNLARPGRPEGNAGPQVVGGVAQGEGRRIAEKQAYAHLAIWDGFHSEAYPQMVNSKGAAPPEPAHALQQAFMSGLSSYEAALLRMVKPQEAMFHAGKGPDELKLPRAYAGKPLKPPAALGEYEIAYVRVVRKFEFILMEWEGVVASLRWNLGVLEAPQGVPPAEIDAARKALEAAEEETVKARAMVAAARQANARRDVASREALLAALESESKPTNQEGAVDRVRASLEGARDRLRQTEEAWKVAAAAAGPDAAASAIARKPDNSKVLLVKLKPCAGGLIFTVPFDEGREGFLKEHPCPPAALVQAGATIRTFAHEVTFKNLTLMIPFYKDRPEPGESVEEGVDVVDLFGDVGQGDVYRVVAVATGRRQVDAPTLGEGVVGVPVAEGEARAGAAPARSIGAVPSSGVGGARARAQAQGVEVVKEGVKEGAVVVAESSAKGEARASSAMEEVEEEGARASSAKGEARAPAQARGVEMVKDGAVEASVVVVEAPPVNEVVKEGDIKVSVVVAESSAKGEARASSAMEEVEEEGARASSAKGEARASSAKGEVEEEEARALSAMEEVEEESARASPAEDALDVDTVTHLASFNVAYGINGDRALAEKKLKVLTAALEKAEKPLRERASVRHAGDVGRSTFRAGRHALDTVLLDEFDAAQWVFQDNELATVLADAARCVAPTDAVLARGLIDEARRVGLKCQVHRAFLVVRASEANRALPPDKRAQHERRRKKSTARAPSASELMQAKHILKAYRVYTAALAAVDESQRLLGRGVSVSISPALENAHTSKLLREAERVIKGVRVGGPAADGDAPSTDGPRFRSSRVSAELGGTRREAPSDLSVVLERIRLHIKLVQGKRAAAFERHRERLMTAQRNAARAVLLAVAEWAKQRGKGRVRLGLAKMRIQQWTTDAAAVGSGVMARRMQQKATGRFVTYLRETAWDLGWMVGQVDEWGTSITCQDGHGFLPSMPPSDRVQVCLCGHKVQRDLAACLTLLVEWLDRSKTLINGRALADVKPAHDPTEASDFAVATRRRLSPSALLVGCSQEMPPEKGRKGTAGLKLVSRSVAAVVGRGADGTFTTSGRVVSAAGAGAVAGAVAVAVAPEATGSAKPLTEEGLFRGGPDASLSGMPGGGEPA